MKSSIVRTFLIIMAILLVTIPVSAFAKRVKYTVESDSGDYKAIVTLKSEFVVNEAKLNDYELYILNQLMDNKLCFPDTLLLQKGEYLNSTVNKSNLEAWFVNNWLVFKEKVQVKVVFIAKV